MKWIGKSLLILVALSVVFQSCKEEVPPPPDPIVGLWTLDGLILGEVPGDFSGWEGLFFTNEEIFRDLDSYTIEFFNDGTYSRELDFPGPNVSDDGLWEINGTTLILDPDDEPLDDEWEIEGDIEEMEMTLSQPAVFRLLPDAVADTLTSYTLSPCGDAPCDPNYPERLDAVWDAAGEEVTLSLWFLFER